LEQAKENPLLDLGRLGKAKTGRHRSVEGEASRVGEARQGKALRYNASRQLPMLWAALLAEAPSFHNEMRRCDLSTPMYSSKTAPVDSFTHSRQCRSQ
jgi:hypothetical protein